MLPFSPAVGCFLLCWVFGLPGALKMFTTGVSSLTKVAALNFYTEALKPKVRIFHSNECLTLPGIIRNNSTKNLNIHNLPNC